MTYAPGGPGQQLWLGQTPDPTPSSSMGASARAGSAVVSLVLGLGAIFALCGGIAMSFTDLYPEVTVLAGLLTGGVGIGAVVSGSVARLRIHKGAGTGNGLATTGMFLGFFGILGLAVIPMLVIASIVFVFSTINM